MRVPNVGWDATPRNGRGDEGSGWGGAKNRMWDAPTPRAVREEGDGTFGIDAREWEEEQIRLDRDWYTGAEEGGVAGDEENNPLAQYDDLAAFKEAEIATKQVVSASFSIFFTEASDMLSIAQNLSTASTICTSISQSSTLRFLLSCDLRMPIMTFGKPIGC